MKRSDTIATVIGALIGAAFGRSWLIWAGEALPTWRGAMEVAGSVVFGVFVVVGALVTLSAFRAPPQQRGERPRPASMVWFAVVIPMEIMLIAAGRHLLAGRLGHPEWIPAWTLFVVGAHFWLFALILRVRAFHKLAGALCATAFVSTIAASLAGVTPLWTILPGFGGAALLWGFAGWALGRVARGRSPV